MEVGVVIPALNEAAYVAATVASARAAGAHHIVVVDGGSDDDTVGRAQQAGATVVSAARGRACQMNAGAAAVRGDVLVFLHADTRLSAACGEALTRAYQDPAVQATLFRLQFDQRAPLLQLYEACTALPFTRIAFGDRALAVRRSAFEAVGGFPEIPVFEDLEMVQRLKKHGGLTFLSTPVVTSARRFAHNGMLKQQWLNLRLWTQYQLGTPPHVLAHRYSYGRARG